MQFKKALLASAATPLFMLALNSAQAAPVSQAIAAAAPASPVVVAQADEENGKHHKRHDEQGQGQQGQSESRHAPQGDAGQGGEQRHEPKPQPSAEQPPKPERHKEAQPPAAAPKAEAPKPQAPKAEAPKPQPPKPQAPKAEAPKAEAPKPEAPKQDHQRDHGRKQGQNQDSHDRSDRQKPNEAAQPKPSAQPATPGADQGARKPGEDKSNASSDQQRKDHKARQGEDHKPGQPGNANPDQARSPQPNDNGKRDETHSGNGGNAPAAVGSPQKPADQANPANGNAMRPGDKAGHDRNNAANGANGPKGDHNGAPGKPLDDRAAKGATDQGAANAKPQRLNVPNGAPILDSAKDHDYRGRGDHGHNGDNGRMNASGNDNGNGDRQRHDQADRQKYRQPVKIQSATEQKGRRVDQAPRYEMPSDVHVDKKVDNRTIVTIDNRTFVENNDHHRIANDARNVYYEDLSQGNTRQVVERPDGTRVVTIRDRYGDIVQRSRFDRSDRETVLIYAPDYDRGDGDRPDYYDAGADLPPLRLTESEDDYILDARDASPTQIVTFLEKPPVERVDRVYTLDQVRYSARLRDIMPRIDLDTITFDTGSADIGQSQARSLQSLAQGILDVVRRDPGQTFLIEGHTDAVGSDQSNLVLSDQRAESVAQALTQDFHVPPENLVTQGYGEQYLKIDTDGAERANRRVTIRRITPLVRPQAAN